MSLSANCKHKDPDGENNILLPCKFVSKPEERVLENRERYGLLRFGKIRLICLNNINEEVDAWTVP